MAELEKLGPKFRVALKYFVFLFLSSFSSILNFVKFESRIAKDPRFARLICTHPGTYADDCIVKRVQESKCYIVATCDRDLKRRIRKIPGVPIMYISQRKYTIERMPEAISNFK
jgi:U3 small nucleolar RNA-associated protein 24